MPSLRLAAACLLLFAAPASAQDRVVAARVGDSPIYVDEVNAAVAKATGNREVDPRSRAVLQAKALNQLIGQRLIDLYLTAQDGYEASQLEIDNAVENLETQLGRKNVTLEAYLKSRGSSEDQLRADLARQIRWRKYLAAQITDEELEAYFDAHRKQYDGTEVRVSHILIRVGSRPEAATLDAARQLAQRVRRQILDEDLSFEEAAREYSSGPSRRKGGDLGYIPRQGVMEEAFSHAAFELDEGQISPPVATSFGVHLIRVTDMKPGKKVWSDVQSQLRLAMAQDLFNALARKQWSQTDIHFTGALPFYKPGTNQLITPSTPD